MRTIPALMCSAVITALWAGGAGAAVLSQSPALTGSPYPEAAQEAAPHSEAAYSPIAEPEAWMVWADNDYLEAGGGFSRAEPGSGEDPGASLDASLAHEHVWSETTRTEHHDAVTHTETKTVKGEPIVEEHTICDACKEIIDGKIDAHYEAHQDHIEAGYITGYPVEMGLGPDTTETVEVVDREAYDETITTRTCTVCGFTEEVR